MCKSAVLFSRRDINLGELLKFICREKHANLTYCRTLAELVMTDVQTMPEVVFHDEESVPFDFRIYKEFKDSKKYHMPTYVIVSHKPEQFNNLDENIISIDKADYAKEIINVIDNVQEKKQAVLSESKKIEIKNKIADYLNELGLTTKYLGYSYIKELVVNVIEDRRNLKSFNSKLYPLVAIKYNTQVINIERNVRNAINVAIESCKNRKLYDEIMGYSNITRPNKVPSNKQFITWLVEKIAI